MIRGGLGIPRDKLVLANPPGVGSTFGSKLGVTCEALLAVACMATGRPVFLQYDYEQQQTYTGKRAPFFIKLKMAADTDGRLLALEADWTVDHGPYADFAELLVQRVRPAPGLPATASRTSVGKEGRFTRTIAGAAP